MSCEPSNSWHFARATLDKRDILLVWAQVYFILFYFLRPQFLWALYCPLSFSSEISFPLWPKMSSSTDVNSLPFYRIYNGFKLSASSFPAEGIRNENSRPHMHLSPASSRMPPDAAEWRGIFLEALETSFSFCFQHSLCLYLTPVPPQETPQGSDPFEITSWKPLYKPDAHVKHILVMYFDTSQQRLLCSSKCLAERWWAHGKKLVIFFEQIIF